MIAVTRGGLCGFLCALVLVAAPAFAAAPPTPQRVQFDALIDTTKQALATDPASALPLAAKADRAADALDPSERPEAHLGVQRLRGEAYSRLGRFDDALTVLDRALAVARRQAPAHKVEADILMSAGNARDGKGELAAALRDYQAAHAIYQRVGDARDQSAALVNISSLYGDANDYPTVLRYLDQAIEAYHDDSGLLMTAYINRGSSLQDQGRYREAEIAYRNALPLTRQLKSPLLRARVLGNIAKVRLKLHNEAGAATLLGEAEALAAGGEAASWRPQLVAIAAQLAFQRHQYDAAARLIGERFAGVDLTTTPISYREAHQTAYDTYRALDDAPRSLVHLAALKRLDDVATGLARSATSALAAANFDFTSQKLRLAQLERDEANRKAHTERLIFIGVGTATAIIIALLTVWLATLARSRNRAKAAAADLALSNTALAKALAAKTEFLATTSHEIRTPLNGILGMTQVMLADRHLAADTRERVALVHSAGVTMRALVDDILDVAKIETGNLTIEHAPFDLSATLTEAAKLWAEQARGKGVGFVLDLARCPTWIEGDAARVRQIAFNLLSNALKFTATGVVSLRVEHDADRYRIVIQDSGIGIAADQLEEIFESFRQADAGTTRQFGGTGLGLAICRNLARAMNGDVAVASVPGVGSTFTVDLPLVTANREAATTPADKGARACDSVVMIVDANPITRAMLKTLVAARCPDAVAVGSLDEATIGGAALVVVDQNALADKASLAALATFTDTSVVVLWRGEPPAEVAAVARVIAKPIGGPALIAALFDPAPSSLVRHAA